MQERDRGDVRGQGHRPGDRESGADRRYWVVLRTLSAAAALAAASWILMLGPGIWQFHAQMALRAVPVVLAAVVSSLASPRRTRRALNTLALVFLLGFVLPNVVLITQVPGSMWALGAIVLGVVLTATLLVAWPWWWQAAFAGTLTAVTLGILAAQPQGAGRRPEELAALGLMLAVGSLASVLGAWLAQGPRERLAASEARFRSLFSSAHEAVLILDPAGRVTECNPAFTRLVDRPAEQVVGTVAADFLSALQQDGRSGAELIDRHVRLALAGEHGQVTGYLVRPDGSEVETEMTCSRAMTPQGVAVQVVLRDVTRERLLERREARERRVEALARLAGGISHQFNNVLGGVLTHAVTLRTEMVRQEHADVLDEIVEAAREGRQLARELLRFARYEAVVLRRVAPGTAMERVVTLARGTVVSGVNLATDVAPDLPDVAADVDELVHAILQLVVNARDAMPRGGTVTLAAHPVRVAAGDAQWPKAEPGDYVGFTVRDTGRGMDAATRERAFEPFGSSRPRYEALGLGLPAVHGIIRAHRGMVRIDSAPGQGTIVHLLVPCWKEPPPPVAPPRRAPVRAAQGTVLVVDDEPIIRHSVSRALTRFGYRVLEAESAEAALSQFAAAEPRVDLVLLDIVFPGGAREVFRELKKQRRDVAVVLSSGFASQDDETIQALLAAGALGFLRKPYEVDDLRRAVAYALGQSDD